MNLPLEILRDTIIVIRPFTDKTEFRIVAVVDASEIGLEAAKAYAKRIVEAVNNYTYKREAEDIYKKLTRITDSPLEELGVADKEKPVMSSVCPICGVDHQILNDFINTGKD
ncbi:MAG: hypothetical protein WC554_06885 [Clostridia bacterium]|jgi:hypothetical protein